TGSTHRGSRVSVHRVRLEHLAVELLRVSGALRLPVPVEALWQHPPHGLWDPQSENFALYPPRPGDDPYAGRWRIATAIANAVSGTAWVNKVHLMGAVPFNEADRQVFARALLVPTPLLSTLSERQKSPERIHNIFQVPLAEAKVRLEELGL